MGFLIIFILVVAFFVWDIKREFGYIDGGDKLFIGIISTATSLLLGFVACLVLSFTSTGFREVKIPVDDMQTVGTNVIVESKDFDEPLIIKTGESKVNIGKENYLKYKIAYGKDNMWTTLFLLNDEYKIKSLSDKEIMDFKSPSEIGIKVEK